MTLIVSYLKDGKLSEGKDEARKLRIRAARYFLMDEVLYKRGFLNLISDVWLQTRRTMCYGKFMKGPVEIIWELDYSSTRSSVQGNIGQLSKQM